MKVLISFVVVLCLIGGATAAQPHPVAFLLTKDSLSGINQVEWKVEPDAKSQRRHCGLGAGVSLLESVYLGGKISCLKRCFF